jgi:hypothetical protein
MTHEATGIPPDVMEAAKAATPCYGADRYCRHEGEESCEDGCEWLFHVAKAIIDERERCARKAEDHDESDGTGPDCQGCGELIAARIRGSA